MAMTATDPYSLGSQRRSHSEAWSNGCDDLQNHQGHQRDTGRSRRPPSYRESAAKSASEALDAYIGSHNGDTSYQVRARYAREVEKLLISKYGEGHFGGGGTPEKGASSDDLRRHLAIKRLVDESYEKLDVGRRETPQKRRIGILSEPKEGHYSLGACPNAMPSVSGDRNQQLPTGPSARHANITHRQSKSDPVKPDILGSPTALDRYVQNESWRDKLLSQSQLDGIKTRLRDRGHSHLGKDGSGSDTSVNTTGKHQFAGSPLTSTSRLSVPSDEHYARALYDEGNIREALNSWKPDEEARTSSTGGATPYMTSSCYGDADDTMTQLLSAKKSASVANVPSWIQDIDVPDTGSSQGHNSTIMTGFGQKPTHAVNKAVSTPNLDVKQSAQGSDPAQFAAQLLNTPKKQLRFDLDLTQSVHEDSTTERAQMAGLTLRTVNGFEEGFLIPEQSPENTVAPNPPKPGILKSPLRKERGRAHDVSFTMEDIAFGALQCERTRDFPENVKSRHARSFSASGRLSSTPVKAACTSPSYDDRPYISEISSVHASSATSSVVSDAPPKYDFIRNPVKYDPVLDLYKVDNKPGDNAGRQVTQRPSIVLPHSAKDGAKPKMFATEPTQRAAMHAQAQKHPADYQRPEPSYKGSYAKSCMGVEEKYLEPVDSMCQAPPSKFSYPGCLADGAKPMPTASPMKLESVQVRPSAVDNTSEPFRAQGDDMSSTHKQYLEVLVQDIEDGSSSIATAITELQDLIYPSGPKSRQKKQESLVSVPESHDLPSCALMLGFNPNSDGLRTPSEMSDLPIRASGLEDSPGFDDLDGDRPWEATNFGPSSPRHGSPRFSPKDRKEFHHKKGGIVDKFLQECRELQSETEQVLNRSSSQSQLDTPAGTMEALKNMLFTMQSMSATGETGAGDAGQMDPSILKQTSCDEALSPSTKQLLSGQQGGDSLERAMKHLNRLKLMVRGNPNQK